MKRIGIIGGSGFIGSHTTKRFLEEGYLVRASVLDLSRKNEYEHLDQLPNSEHLEIFPLDVENATQLRDFLAGCHIIIHCGTPFKLDYLDPVRELFEPTINGTRNLLNTINDLETIEKIVFIASIAALNTNFPMPAGNKNPADTFDEMDDYFTSEESHPYAQAKFIANQTVNQFINEHPDLNYEITTISPAMVIGKPMVIQDEGTSYKLQSSFKSRIASDPFIQMMTDHDIELAVVDVKDVAQAIYKAAITKGIHGKNYMISNESWRVSDLSAMLNLQEPMGSSRIVYKNDAAIKDLKLTFNPTRVALGEFSEL